MAAALPLQPSGLLIALADVCVPLAPGRFLSPPGVTPKIRNKYTPRFPRIPRWGPPHPPPTIRRCAIGPAARRLLGDRNHHGQFCACPCSPSAIGRPSSPSARHSPAARLPRGSRLRVPADACRPTDYRTARTSGGRAHALLPRVSANPWPLSAKLVLVFSPGVAQKELPLAGAKRSPCKLFTYKGL